MQEELMYAVVRTYSGAGAKELFSLLEQRKADVEAVMRRVPGLVSYTLVRSAEGGIAVTVCQDKAGAEESTRLAKEWIEEHASELGSKLPTIDLGSVLVQIT
jgi:hypothetical protein